MRIGFANLADDFKDDFDANPFEADASLDPRGHQEVNLPPDTKRGMVGHVFVLGVLMAVYGALFVILGLCTVGYGVFMPEMLKNNPAWQNNPQFGNNPPMPPDELLKMMTTGTLIAGGMFVLLGALYLVGGIQVSRFRGRMLGIVALSVGLLSVFGCYCIPTSVALFVYGLVVLLNEPVKTAFGLGDRGFRGAEIQQAFARLPLGN